MPRAEALPYPQSFSIAAETILNPGPGTADVQFPGLRMRTASPEVKSAIADLNLFARGVADSSQQFESNQSHTFRKGFVMPEGERKWLGV